jgi:hypothetical protein
VRRLDHRYTLDSRRRSRCGNGNGNGNGNRNRNGNGNGNGDAADRSCARRDIHQNSLIIS